MFFLCCNRFFLFVAGVFFVCCIRCSFIVSIACFFCCCSWCWAGSRGELAMGGSEVLGGGEVGGGQIPCTWEAG